MVKGQSVYLIPGHLRYDKLPRRWSDAILLEMVHHLDAILSHKKRSLSYVAVWGDGGVMVEFFYYLDNLVGLPPLVGRGFKLLDGLLVGHMTIVEVVRTIFELFDHLSGS